MPPKTDTTFPKKAAAGSAYRGSAQQQVLVCLQGGPVELTLDPVQRLEALESGLGILGQLLHWKQLLEEER